LLSRFTGKSAATTRFWIAISGIGKPACDLHGEHATEADVALRVEGLVEDPDECLRGQIDALVDEGLVRILGAMELGAGSWTLAA